MAVTEAPKRLLDFHASSIVSNDYSRSITAVHNDPSFRTSVNQLFTRNDDFGRTWYRIQRENHHSRTYNTLPLNVQDGLSFFWQGLAAIWAEEQLLLQTQVYKPRMLKEKLLISERIKAHISDRVRQPWYDRRVLVASLRRELVTEFEKKHDTLEQYTPDLYQKLVRNFRGGTDIGMERWRDLSTQA